MSLNKLIFVFLLIGLSANLAFKNTKWTILLVMFLILSLDVRVFAVLTRNQSLRACVEMLLIFVPVKLVDFLILYKFIASLVLAFDFDNFAKFLLKLITKRLKIIIQTWEIFRAWTLNPMSFHQNEAFETKLWVAKGIVPLVDGLTLSAVNNSLFTHAALQIILFNLQIFRITKRRLMQNRNEPGLFAFKLRKH